tara:strand:- start:1300 stop:1593 length:294 start_codon:yes stop_codon:yes gene_type:complete
MSINPSQRKYLKSLAHHLKPIVNIGKEGVTEGAIHFVSTALEKHELLKIKFSKNKDNKQDMSRRITEQTNSLQVSIIGNNLIIFKQSEDPKNRHIKI